MSRTRAFIITATRPGVCAETGVPVPTGARRLYIPASHRKLPAQVYAEDTATFRPFVQNEAANAEARREQEFAQAWNMPDANW